MALNQFIVCALILSAFGQIPIQIPINYVNEFWTPNYGVGWGWHRQVLSPFGGAIDYGGKDVSPKEIQRMVQQMVELGLKVGKESELQRVAINGRVKRMNEISRQMQALVSKFEEMSRAMVLEARELGDAFRASDDVSRIRRREMSTLVVNLGEMARKVSQKVK